MKRFRRAAMALVTTVALAPSVSAQQPAGDAWQINVTPYLLAAGMGGTTEVRGVSADLEMGASEIFSNLEFGAMGLVAARKGDWGVATDVIFMALGATTDRPAADADFDQTALAIYGLRRLNAVTEASFGIRVNGLDGGLTFKQQSVLPAGTELSRSAWWVDPIVGLRVHSHSTRRVDAGLYGEIGGFGLGSDFSWQIFPVVGVRLSQRASLELGYRWLSIDYAKGEGSDRFAWDILTQGPLAGIKLQF